VCTKGVRECPQWTLRWPSGLPPYLISVMPLSALSILAQQRPSAALFVYDRSIGRIPAISVLREIFGLTAAEARVAILLARGKTVREIVSMLGLSSNTIRTQLRQVFAKTQTKRQSELMRVLLPIPPDLTSEH
jgi:DNA-binding CsgD family transcriptional regulator